MTCTKSYPMGGVRVVGGIWTSSREIFCKKIPSGRAGCVSNRRSDFVTYAAVYGNVAYTGEKGIRDSRLTGPWNWLKFCTRLQDQNIRSHAKIEQKKIGTVLSKGGLIAKMAQNRPFSGLNRT